ncbi:MAG: hypothetical protein IKZ06_03410 [Oscillospiraceae bacterium]|nr:hypothetical protein [Oscillospiraceae bacterium]
MDRRRTLLAGGVEKPLYIFQPGFADVENCNLVLGNNMSKSITKHSNSGVQGCLRLQAAVSRTAWFHIDCTKYKKLVAVMNAEKMAGMNKTKIGFLTSETNNEDNLIDKKSVGYTSSPDFLTFEFDISQYSGDTIFGVCITDTGSVFIKELWLE